MFIIQLIYNVYNKISPVVYFMYHVSILHYMLLPFHYNIPYNLDEFKTFVYIINTHEQKAIRLIINIVIIYFIITNVIHFK